MKSNSFCKTEENKKLSKDIGYTLISFFILAISGVIINIAVTLFRDPHALGIFNLSYAVYIAASQFAVLGIHYSVLRHAAFYNIDLQKRSQMFSSAFGLCLILGLCSALIVYLSEGFFFFLFASHETALAIKYAGLGLIFFPANKVILAYLNALHKMKLFSFLQALRYIIVMGVVTYISWTDLPIYFSSWSFLIGESVTIVMGLYFLWIKKLVTQLSLEKEWIRTHLIFGSKGLFAGIFAEINSRLDVILVGIFLNEMQVGVYSFAAMLADGLYHILAMIRINFNPLLVSYLKNKQWNDAIDLRKSASKYIIPIMFLISLIIISSYYIFAFQLVPAKGLQTGIYSLSILLGGLICISYLVPFDNLLIISGHPGYQTIQQVFMVGSNLLVATLLIPIIGIKGAAIGTIAGYCVGLFLLNYLTKKLIGWHLFSNVYLGA